MKGQGGAPVTLYLNVSEGRNSTLYTKTARMRFLPEVGDQMHLGYDAEEDESTRSHPVFKRWWEHDGTVIVEMKPIHVDPPEQWNWQTNGKYETTWFTDQEKSGCGEWLLANGWETYR